MTESDCHPGSGCRHTQNRFSAPARLKLVLLFLLGSISATPAGEVFVRKVDYSDAPQMRELSEHARQLGDEVYPKIFKLLAEDASRPPGQFDLIWKKRLESDFPAITRRTTVKLSAYWLMRNPTNLAWVA